MELYLSAKRVNSMLSKLAFVAATQLDGLSGKNVAAYVLQIINEDRATANLGNAIYKYEQLQNEVCIDFQI